MRDTRRYGLALFTTAPIAAGETVVEFTGETHEAERASLLPNDPPDYIQDHVIQVGPTTYRASGGVGQYLSHSCEPNCGVKGTTRFVAMRDIDAGEELTFDYAMTEDSDWRLECSCDSDRCRGLITGYRDLPEEARQRYRGYLSSWLAGPNR